MFQKQHVHLIKGESKPSLTKSRKKQSACTVYPKTRHIKRTLGERTDSDSVWYFRCQKGRVKTATTSSAPANLHPVLVPIPLRRTPKELQPPAPLPNVTHNQQQRVVFTVQADSAATKCPVRISLEHKVGTPPSRLVVRDIGTLHHARESFYLTLP